MTCRVAHSKYRWLLAAAAVVWLLEGCTMVPRGLSQHPRRPHGAAGAQPEAPGPDESAADTEAQPRRDGPMLAAVEEFLKRTEDYEWPSGAGPNVASSTSEHARSATTPPRPVKAGRIESQPLGRGEGLRVSSEAGRGFNASDRDSRFENMPPATFQDAGHPTQTPPAAVANTHVALTDPPPLQSPLALPVLQSMSIREAVEPMVEPGPSTPSSMSNQGLDVQADNAVMSANRFVEQLEAQAHQANDFDSLWRLILVQVAMNHITEAPEVLSSLSTDAQQILSGLIRLIVSARTAARNPLLLGEEALRTTDEFRQLLADRADPEVSVVAICRKVVTFGVYEEMNSNEFIAGRSVQTIIYSEIRNLRSEQTPDGQYRTLLATRLEVLTEEGESVWQHEEPEIQDLCRRRRTDFFIAQRVTLPATLGEGSYVLKVFAEDKLSGKANEASHQFTVHSPHSLATNG